MPRLPANLNRVNRLTLSDREARVKSVSAPDLARGPFLLTSGYDAASHSKNRGYLYWPTLDTKRELTSYSDREIRRRIHWLYANFGFCRRLIHGMAKLIGFLTPVPATKDEEWNELVLEEFLNQATSAEVFDRAGRFDFFMGQLMANRLRFKDGRSLALLTETTGARARLAFYEAHQMGNGGKQVGPEWKDGVRCDKFGKHVAYNLRDGEQTDQWTPIQARDAIYFGNFENHGMIHGLSILTHAVTNMIDVVETRGFLKTSLKRTSHMGMVVEQDMGHTLQIPGGGMLGPIVGAQQTMNDGTTQTVNYEILQMGAGNIPQLRPGQRIQTISDNRPSPSQTEFERALLEDVILGTDLPPSALYYVAGMTGPEVRFTMEEIQRWVLNQQFLTANRWSNRYYTYWLAKELKSGRIQYPKREKAWWKVEWIGQSDLTIDKGRDGQLSIMQLETGLTSWSEQWGQKGKSWKRAVRQRIQEVKWALDECKENDLSYADVFGAMEGKPMSEEEKEEQRAVMEEMARQGEEGEVDE